MTEGQFDKAQTVAGFLAEGNEKEARNDLILLLDEMDRSGERPNALVNHLAREVGLYPHIDDSSASFSDLLAKDLFTVDVGGGKRAALHRDQSILLKRLVEGRSLVVSAPTSFGKSFVIDKQKCIGCGACYSICPHHAVSILSLGGLWNALTGGRIFREKLVEYALAAHAGKKNIYINFVVNVTSGCDCEPHPMRKCIADVGVFASTDPVAIDKACYDAVAGRGKRFRGKEQLAYAEKIRLGSCTYDLIEL